MKRFEMFQMYDYHAIKTHLEKMALSGYKLKKVGVFFWEYEKIVPQKLHYDITIFPKNSKVGETISRNDLEFIEYCNASGWTYVTGKEQMHIFVSEETKPIPIDTDKEAMLEAIRKIVKRRIIIPSILLILMSIVNLSINFSGFKDILSSYWELTNVTTWCAIGIMQGNQLLQYFLWVRKAKRCVIEDQPFPKRRGYVIEYVVLIYALVGGFFAILGMIFGGNADFTYGAYGGYQRATEDGYSINQTEETVLESENWGADARSEGSIEFKLMDVI